MCEFGYEELRSAIAAAAEEIRAISELPNSRAHNEDALSDDVTSVRYAAASRPALVLSKNKTRLAIPFTQHARYLRTRVDQVIQRDRVVKKKKKLNAKNWNAWSQRVGSMRVYVHGTVCNIGRVVIAFDTPTGVSQVSESETRRVCICGFSSLEKISFSRGDKKKKKKKKLDRENFFPLLRPFSSLSSLAITAPSLLRLWTLSCFLFFKF